MRILMVSMFSNHFFNWTEQLRESGHEIYWIDVFDSKTYVEKIDFVHQNIGWRYRWDYPGRYWVKNHMPGVNRLINKINQRKLSGFVDRKIEEIKPDVIQTFVMQSTAIPLAPVIEKYPGLKWIYSAWGNDLFYRQQNKEDLINIRKTLPRIDYMFSDCERDQKLALNLGFRGTSLGVFPGGGGYDLEKYKPWIAPFQSRDVILIKGYQGKLGRCNVILEAVSAMRDILAPYNIIVFGDNNEVRKFASEKGLTQWNNFFLEGYIPHERVLKLLGNSLIYVGNCISDGMPNTLLEAIIMGAFPIQSNPGGATAEIIVNEQNGLLIEDPEEPGGIQALIYKAIKNRRMMGQAKEFNFEHIRPNLEREKIKIEVQKQYRKVELALNLI
ncbi:MAG: glycosyltransferase [Bacteroidota bacterium]